VRVVVAADLLVGSVVFAALGDGGGDLGGGVALRKVVRFADWDEGPVRLLTVLPQVTAPWRLSIGAGAAMVDAARARTAKIEVYMMLVLV
jgi:hypothetical protein